jgi:hypothetical protein
MENQETKPENPSAFPVTATEQSFWNQAPLMPEPGMSLRDHFAGLAMQGILSNSDTMREITRAYEKGNKINSFEECLSNMSFGFSDAMLKQR